MSAHNDNILKCKDFLEGKTDYKTLATALAHLIENIDFVEKYIDTDNPFKQHFYSFFEEGNFNLEDCFAIYEDIVIFFREKLLRVGIQNMSPIEMNILYDFENSDQDANSFVGMWYYEKLPALIYGELSNSIGYSGSAWKQWWEKSRKI